MPKHSSTQPGSLSPNLLECLEKIASHPDAVDLAKHLTELIRTYHLSLTDAQVAPELAEHDRLVAIALNLVKRRGIVNPPYFKGMTHEQIRSFIDRWSSDNERVA